ncbi:MAG: ABC transporter substrate-binding protein [Planctomycetota bacterium]|nr:ABC transporter substrate-binding protein [Planctomycetota bacterium]
MSRHLRLLALLVFLVASQLVLPVDLFADYDQVEIDGRMWTTNSSFELLGSLDAEPGGVLRTNIPNFLPTLRMDGPNSNLTTITDIYGLTHDRLLGIHPETLEWIPALASHWIIEKNEDHQVFWFRIDERATFSDGTKIKADDVLASFEHITDPDIKDPSSTKLFNDMYETPVVHDDRTISVKTKKLNWRLLIYFSVSLVIYPADQIRIPGDVYLDEFNWKMIPGSGPYILREDSIQQEISVTLYRNESWWGWERRDTQGLYNFDQIQLIVVRDRELAFEKFKAGELDYYKVLRAQRWAEETGFEAIRNGWIRKQKIYNEQPQSFSGYMMNMRQWPFDDKNVRLAFCYGVDRKTLFDKLFFNQYEYIDSYYPGGRWGNPRNRKIRYNPGRAERFLDRAGYTKRNEDGIRVHEKTGKALQFTIEYGFASSTRIHQVVAEGLRKIGIGMELKLVDYNALMKKISERQFTVHMQAWRGILFPNPITAWHSDLANEPYNNNISGIANEEVDQLMEKYDRTFDIEEQTEYMREIDSLIFKDHPVALTWYGPFVRILSWNHFGQPEKVLSRIGDDHSLWKYWWSTPELQQRLAKAREEGTTLPVGPDVLDPWGLKARMEAGGEVKE